MTWPVTQCHAWKAVPPALLLALAFLSELLLPTVAFVALLSLKKKIYLQEPPAALNSKGYNDSVLPEAVFPFPRSAFASC